MRPKANPTQAGLSRSQRQRNLASALAISQDQRQRIANWPVLFIDDVMTTGTSLYEAAKTRHRAGNGPVRGLILTRVLRHGLKPLSFHDDFSIERYDRKWVLQYGMAAFQDY